MAALVDPSAQLVVNLIPSAQLVGLVVNLIGISRRCIICNLATSIIIIIVVAAAAATTRRAIVGGRVPHSVQCQHGLQQLVVCEDHLHNIPLVCENHRGANASTVAVAAVVAIVDGGSGNIIISSSSSSSSSSSRVHVAFSDQCIR